MKATDFDYVLAKKLQNKKITNGDTFPGRQGLPHAEIGPTKNTSFFDNAEFCQPCEYNNYTQVSAAWSIDIKT